ncbi:MAG: methyltransferase domain-containing protein [Acidimicrobiia bacterium]
MPETLDERNADFWNELCGTTLARSIGVSARTPQQVAKFDAAFLRMYPYLDRYLPRTPLDGVRVLEVGLGYGTLGGLLIGRGAAYTGVDLAIGPVEMMQYRIGQTKRGDSCGARQASVLDLPFEDASFDRVYSIGCLHHTGDIPRAVGQLRRVLRPGGEAVVMLYNRWSVRRLLRAPYDALVRLRSRDNERLRARYDTDSRGRVAPHTDFVSTRQANRIFAAAGFRDVCVDRRNLQVPHFPALRLTALRLRLDWLLGLDLYIRAVA